MPQLSFYTRLFSPSHDDRDSHKCHCATTEHYLHCEFLLVEIILPCEIVVQ